MKRLLLCSVMVVLVGGTGCATKSESAGLERGKEPVAVQEAPLGSRIRKKSAIAPTQGGTREDVEMSRVQAGAVQTGVFQKTGS